MKRVTSVLLVALAGCASPVWDKAGATEDGFRVDQGQCMAQGYSAPVGTPRQLIFNSCMEGKGWRQIPG